MPYLSRHAVAIFAVCVVTCVTLASIAEEKPDIDALASVEQPKWAVGDTWTIETVSEKIQGREATPARKSPPIRWQFRVAELEKLAGRDCYRIEVECLARGRIRPKSVMWVDEESGFLRQYQTELAVNGKMRPIVESYDHAKDEPAPVVTPISAVPIVMPAFAKKGSKSSKAVNSFTYTSAPVPAGAKAKDLGMTSFAYEVSQTANIAGAKALEVLPGGRAKDLDAKPITQVNINTPHERVTQLWQAGKPWPVFVDNGVTKAYLVND
jgi:hypothetical protein